MVSELLPVTGTFIRESEDGGAGMSTDNTNVNVPPPMNKAETATPLDTDKAADILPRILETDVHVVATPALPPTRKRLLAE